MADDGAVVTGGMLQESRGIDIFQIFFQITHSNIASEASRYLWRKNLIKHK